MNVGNGTSLRDHSITVSSSLRPKVIRLLSAFIKAQHTAQLNTRLKALRLTLLAAPGPGQTNRR